MSDKKDKPLNSDELSQVEDILTSLGRPNSLEDVESQEKELQDSEVQDSEAQDSETQELIDDSEVESNTLVPSPEEPKKDGSFGVFGMVFRGLWRIFRIAMLVGIVIGALFAAAYVLQQDELVTSKFEGKRWSLPARVFARPLELYEGQSLKADDLHKELQLLNYSFVTHLVGTGQFKREKNSFFIQTRGFKFAEDQEISRRIRIDIKKNKIIKLSNTESKEPLTLMRLEPVLIGNFYPRHNEDRVLVKLDDVTPLLAKGLVAVEDKKFYEHYGVNLKSIIRALLANAKAGRRVQGASTLTQQLVKNFFLTNEKSYKRKATEAIMALLLEVHYDKDEIIEAYLNEIYLGQNGKRAVHGFGLASQFYFNKPISELKKEQVALLIGIAKGPSVYNPRTKPKSALKRRNLVLDVMAREGVLDSKEIANLKNRPLGVTKNSPPSVSPFPSYLELVKKQLQRDYQENDLRSEGLLIFTSMDPVIQIKAEEVLEKRLKKLEKSRRMKKGKLNGAMVVSSVQGAEILAVVGGRNARFAGYNRALSASRQIGSLIKPAVYLAALESGEFTLGTPIDSGPVTVRLSRTKLWKPKNYSGKDLGMVPFEQALVHSMNTPTVRIGITLGLDKIIAKLHMLGLNKEAVPNPSLLLGAIQLTPMEVQQIYQTIAAGGTYTPLTAIRNVMDSYGKALRRYPLQVKQVVSEESVYLLTYVMNKITKEGTAQYLRHALPRWKNSAGKTGTTNKNVDSWYAGFTGQHVASVWVGRDDNKPTGFTGSAGALRVWADLIKEIPTKPFKPKRPRQIKFVNIDRTTGQLYNSDCGVAITIPFIKGTEPKKKSECHTEIYYEIGDDSVPSWQQTAPNPYIPNESKTDRMNRVGGAANAKIWNKQKQINQNAIKKTKPRKPAKADDPSAWIDNLMRR